MLLRKSSEEKTYLCLFFTDSFFPIFFKGEINLNFLNYPLPPPKKKELRREFTTLKMFEDLGDGCLFSSRMPST